MARAAAAGGCGWELGRARRLRARRRAGSVGTRSESARFRFSAVVGAGVGFVPRAARRHDGRDPGILGGVGASAAWRRLQIAPTLPGLERDRMRVRWAQVGLNILGVLNLHRACGLHVMEGIACACAPARISRPAAQLHGVMLQFATNGFKLALPRLWWRRSLKDGGRQAPLRTGVPGPGAADGAGAAEGAGSTRIAWDSPPNRSPGRVVGDQ